MKLSGIFVTLLCSLVLLMACKKNDDNDTPNNISAKKKMLEAGKWQLSASIATIHYMGKDTTADLYPDLETCEKDDFVEFFSDGTVTRDENTNKCAGNPQTSTFTWILLENETQIAIYDSNPDTLNFEITEKEMKFSKTRPNNSGIPINYIQTYKNIR